MNHVGITEPWKIQRSCGQKENNYKVSYHITVPGVKFESHKHLKQWFKEKCKIVQEQNGFYKNGNSKSKHVWYLGKTPIDWKIYQSGSWRYPMCRKSGSNRVLEYNDEPMTFDVFQKLSIHYIEEDARFIDVALKEYTPNRSTNKRTREASHIAGVRLTEEEKQEYHLKGEFVWDGEQDGNSRAKAISESP